MDIYKDPNDMTPDERLQAFCEIWGRIAIRAVKEDHPELFKPKDSPEPPEPESPESDE